MNIPHNDLLCVAKSYAALGCKVFQLHFVRPDSSACSCRKTKCKPGKHPVASGWQREATKVLATMQKRGWWTGTAPRYNIGVLCGKESGVFAVGPDGEEGIADLSKLEEKYGKLPRTVTSTTPGGGRHHFFRCPTDGKTIRNGRNIRGTKIDVRGEGGYVVGVGSRTDKGVYEWLHSPEDTEVAAAPEWLIHYVRGVKMDETPPPPAGPPAGSTSDKPNPNAGRPTAEQRAADYLGRIDGAVSGAGGHDLTFRAARAAVYGFDLGAEDGFRVLWHHYNPKCVPPWTEAELRHKCQEADTKTFDKPRGWLLSEGAGSKDGSTFYASANANAEAHHCEAADGGRKSPPPPHMPHEDIESMDVPGAPPWPAMDPTAYHGLAGEIVRTIEPESEADPVAILGQLLAAFGSAVGRGPYFPVEGNRHYPNLYMTIVGKSVHGRKGTSWGRTEQVMRLADAHWAENCIVEGMSSGEGLIQAVRDPLTKTTPEGDTQVVEEGVTDKRLCVVEGEFAQVLRVLRREGNTLSPTIRKFWDSGKSASMTKNRQKATDAHVSIVGHITRDELRGYLSNTEMFNGFANRFLWMLCKRARLLPGGGRHLDLTPQGFRLRDALDRARRVSLLKRSDPAERLWYENYGRLTADRDGLFGAATTRADAQTLRLSMLYALLDGKPVIDQEHLAAALAFWDYAERSAAIIFDEVPASPLVVQILEKLKGSPDGMTRTDLHHAFSNNGTSKGILAALAVLRDRGQARCETLRTGKPGAPAERWFACEEVSSFNSFVRSPSGDGKAQDREEYIP